MTEVNRQKILGHFQFAVMSAIPALGQDAYPAKIQRHLSEAGKQEIALSQVFVALQRLERQGYLGRDEIKPPPQPGGRRRSVYHIKPDGQKVMDKTLDLYQFVADK